jgi:hypothetical protein
MLEDIEGPVYVFDRGRPFIDPISEARARQIFDEAAMRPGAELEGTVEEGFKYTAARSSSISYLKVKVYPLELAEQWKDK